MKTKKRLSTVSIILGAIILIATCLPALAQDSRFYICLTNDTKGEVKYTAEWCTRDGHNCTGYKRWTVGPGETIKHWGPPGNGRMDVKIHTGGEGSSYMNYSFEGAKDHCSPSSSYKIRYNNRGFLRIYE